MAEKTDTRWSNTVRTAIIAATLGWLVYAGKVDDLAGTISLVALAIPAAAESIVALIAGRKAKIE